MSGLTYLELSHAVENAAAFRRRQRLQPIGGIGDKVLPPTYPGNGRDSAARHVFEVRRLDGQAVQTVLLDSVQSSVGGGEEALLALSRAKAIELPYVSVSFAETEVPEVGEITSLDAPHRIFDAILRDSQLDGKPLMRSDLGVGLAKASMRYAGAILEASPNALLFGAWNSTGEGGGLGAKFPRCYVSEIVGINVPTEQAGDGETISAGKRTGSRIDPLGILKGVPVFKSQTSWAATAETKDFKKSKPSEINHGNIAPSVQPLGVTMEYAEHTTVVGFAALRRLFFGGPERDRTARAYLAALGLVTHLAQVRRGYALRSRCELVAEGAAPLELIAADGASTTVALDFDAAVALYAEALAAARGAGFTMNAEPTRLVPQDRLIYLVKTSRELALAGKGGEDDANAGA